MKHEIMVENIKCGGCANTVHKKVEAIDGVQSVDVDVEAGRVTVEGPEQARPAIVEALTHAGYPEVGSVEGLKAAKAKVKSFASCAIGRMSD